MMGKRNRNRSLASFADVADENKNINDNVNTNVEQNDNVEVNEDVNVNKSERINPSVNESNNANINVNIDNKSYLDTLIEGTAKKDNDSETILTGIYIQKDLVKVLNSLAKKGGRGAKSRIVNEALRSIFIEKGLL